MQNVVIPTSKYGRILETLGDGISYVNWLQRFLGRISSEKMKDEVRRKGDFVKSSFDCLTIKHQLRQKLIKRLGGSLV